MPERSPVVAEFSSELSHLPIEHLCYPKSYPYQLRAGVGPLVIRWGHMSRLPAWGSATEARQDSPTLRRSAH